MLERIIRERQLWLRLRSLIGDEDCHAVPQVDDLRYRCFQENGIQQVFLLEPPASDFECPPSQSRNRRTGLLLRATASTRFAVVLGGGRDLPSRPAPPSKPVPSYHSQRDAAHRREIQPVCRNAERQTCRRVKAKPAAEACRLVLNICYLCQGFRPVTQQQVWRFLPVSFFLFGKMVSFWSG